MHNIIQNQQDGDGKHGILNISSDLCYNPSKYLTKATKIESTELATWLTRPAFWLELHQRICPG